MHQIELEIQNEALRESQLALEHSRDQYLDLYDFAPVGYLTLDKRTMITAVNLTGASLLGADRHKLIGILFPKFITPDHIGKWGAWYKRAMGSPEKAACELDLVRSDGGLIRVRLEGIRSEYDPAGRVLRIALSDITDQARTRNNWPTRARISNALSRAYTEISEGQEKLRENEARLTASLAEKRAAPRRDTAAGRRTGAYRGGGPGEDRELSRSEHQLREALAEKEILLSEIHHRVKNNLTAFISLLSLDGTRENTDEGRALRKDLQNRARSMALIHETLYRTGNSPA